MTDRHRASVTKPSSWHPESSKQSSSLMYDRRNTIIRLRRAVTRPKNNDWVDPYHFSTAYQYCPSIIGLSKQYRKKQLSTENLSTHIYLAYFNLKKTPLLSLLWHWNLTPFQIPPGDTAKSPTETQQHTTLDDNQTTTMTPNPVATWAMEDRPCSQRSTRVTWRERLWTNDLYKIITMTKHVPILTTLRYVPSFRPRALYVCLTVCMYILYMYM